MRQKGASYTASIFVAAPASAAAASPSLRASTPGCAARSAKSLLILSLLTFGVRSLVPLYVERAPPLHRRPGAVGDYGDAA